MKQSINLQEKYKPCNDFPMVIKQKLGVEHSAGLNWLAGSETRDEAEEQKIWCCSHDSIEERERRTEKNTEKNRGVALGCTK